MKGQTCIVTGGAKGIGKAIALELAKRGCNVVINYNSSIDAAKETAKEIEELGVTCLLVQADVSSSIDCKRLFEEAVKITGKVDILVNNAGITRDGLALRMSDEDFDAVIKTNLYGTFYCMREAYKLMMRAKYGRIISLTSVVGVHGNAGQTNYSASKAGIIGLTKSMAKELASRNVTVNAVAPGFIETDMTAAMTDAAKTATINSIPSKKMGQASDIANTVAFLASKESGYITGQVIGVDGGMGM